MIMSGLRVADDDIGSSLRRGVRRAFSGGVFAHAFPFDLQSVGDVDEAVEDGVGEGGVAEQPKLRSLTPTMRCMADHSRFCRCGRSEAGIISFSACRTGGAGRCANPRPILAL